MKLVKLSANKSTFKTISFRKGFNFIVAEKSESSGDKDSTNGLGKSLLLEIVDFCLGANPSETLKKMEMQDWKFYLDISIEDEIFTISRYVDDPKNVMLQGDLDKIGLQNLTDNSFNIDILKSSLGNKLFGLNESRLSSGKNRPSYRSLISYFMRTGSNGFSEPFAFFAKQPAWSKQVNNAYLLGLDWELSTKLSQLRIKLDQLDKANKAIDSGVMSDFGGTVGELESEKINLLTKLDAKTERLKKFQVYDDYREVQSKANELTENIHNLLNTTALNAQIIEKYKADLDSEEGKSFRVEQVYKDAGIVFSESLSRTLAEVEKFHSDVVTNRKNYLRSEMDSLSKENESLQQKIFKLTDERSSFMSILDSHGALDEYALLQNEVNKEHAKIADIESRIARLTEIEELISKLRVETEQMVTKMRRDYSERLPTIAAAVKMFNANSEYLYSQSGTLSIDITKDGYRFKVDIKKSGSDGVGNMKIFCYDLMLAEYWATIMKHEIPLFHDSKIFADVDPRQIAKAIELAKSKSENLGFQYICSMNSSYIPYEYLSDNFKDTLENYTIVKYHDKDDSGTLLGITF
jgi:uncharacterized protein YydD (DUF2326 family)